MADSHTPAQHIYLFNYFNVILLEAADVMISHMSLESLIHLLAGGWLLVAAGCWLLAAGCWMLAAGCWLLAAGCWLLAAGCWLLAAASSSSSPRFRQHEVEFLSALTRSRKINSKRIDHTIVMISYLSLESFIHRLAAGCWLLAPIKQSQQISSNHQPWSSG